MAVVEYYVAWWNLENLFDEENAPPQRRPEKVARAVGRDLTGWTAALRDRKIAQLAAVIARMNQGAGPDLLGVAEVENRFVLELLTDAVRGVLGRDYAIAHADTIDARGFDVAFLYDPARLSAPPEEIFFLTVMKRHATREIVQVNFRTTAKRTWAVFGNHWPSRSGGRWESAGYPGHRRGNTGLLARKGPRSPRPGHPSARPGRLQRRAFRHQPGPCTPARSAKPTGSATPAQHCCGT